MTHSPYLAQWATIRRVRQETEMEKLFELELPNKTPLGHRAGQFVELGIFGIGEAPISISSSRTGRTASTSWSGGSAMSPARCTR